MTEEYTQKNLAHDKIACKLVDEIVQCTGGDASKLDVEEVIEDWTYAVNEQKKVLYSTKELDPRYTDPAILKDDLLERVQKRRMQKSKNKYKKNYLQK